jgi:histone H3/H4
MAEKAEDLNLPNAVIARLVKDVVSTKIVYRVQHKNTLPPLI